MSLFDRDEISMFGSSHDIPLVSVQVCWNCEYLQGHLGKYSSMGPTCGECDERLDTYSVVA